jgi:hypothetical protein
MTSHETSGAVESVFVESVFVEADSTERVTTELMIFKDPASEEYQIFMDIGTHKTAYRLYPYMDENWEELKKFPKYATHFLHTHHSS